jgi:carboxypeptidase Q
MRIGRILSCCLLISAGPASAAGPAVDMTTIDRIADEGFNHGQVIDLAATLADQIGGRMTNSPAMRKAEQWTQSEFKSWGLKNVHPEGFEFGRGWWIEASHVRMVTPRALDLRAIPIAWTPATNGPLSAPIVIAPIHNDADLAQWKGKLAGKIVLISYPAPPKDETDPAFKRLTTDEIGKLVYREPSFDPDSATDTVERLILPRKIDAFMAAEGALALVKMSRNDDALVHGEGYFYKMGQTLTLPEIELAAEDYRRLARLAKLGEVKLEIDNRVHFEDSDSKAYNIIADIPGKDPKAGYVMAGAHLDSWVAADGAADNGAGSVVVMEAARILATLGVQPKRTIRFALWAGEEQGLIGSSAYAEQHLAKRPPASDPELANFGPYFGAGYPIQPLPGYYEMAGYFNLDNGSGKIRGIYAEGNFAAAPTLRDWLAPFASLGAATVVATPTGSTDHVSMTRIGLPAFQFIQDPLDYGTLVHHTNLDTFDHLRIDDLRQAAVIMATMLLDAANSEEPLPRNVLPTQPAVTDPFLYKDPAKK